jgi:cytochrome c553
MPNVVAHGPAKLGNTTRGCGSCHLPNGKGRPENAGVAGLPTAYFIRQIQDFRSGKRHSADPRKPNTNTMIELAKSLSDEELKQAAEYFGSMKWTPWISVVENGSRAEDSNRGQSVPPSCAGEDRADQWTHHRDAGK